MDLRKSITWDKELTGNTRERKGYCDNRCKFRYKRIQFVDST
jgi:hypothetical protein